MPMISVIVPVYKVELYLHRCVDSILEQTFTDFELILVDDGSPDNCPGICDQYARQDSRVHVIHQANQGQAAARNHAVALSKGTWLHFVDSDDVIHPQMLEYLYTAVIASNASISMCSAIEAAEIPSSFSSPVPLQYTVCKVDENYLHHLYLSGKHQYWIVWGKLIHKSIVEKIPFENGRIYEDNAVVCKWLYEAGTVTDLQCALYFYRINLTGTTKKPFNMKQLDFLWALEQQEQFYYQIGFSAMQQAISDRIILSSATHYTKVKFELGNHSASRKLKHAIFKRIRSSYSKSKLSKCDWLYIAELIYPRLMHFYWIANAAKNKLLKVR